MINGVHSYDNFFIYDQRHLIAMIQHTMLRTTVVHSYDHQFHTRSAMKIDRYETFHEISLMNSVDHEAMITGLKKKQSYEQL